MLANKSGFFFFNLFTTIRVIWLIAKCNQKKCSSLLPHVDLFVSVSTLWRNGKSPNTLHMENDVILSKNNTTHLENNMALSQICLECAKYILNNLYISSKGKVWFIILKQKIKNVLLIVKLVSFNINKAFRNFFLSAFLCSSQLCCSFHIKT